MKAMKAMKKAMKAMKRVSKIAKGRFAKVLVFKGKKEKTASGQTSGMLMKNKYGSIVSKKRSAASKKNKWVQAVKSARSQLGLKGFVAIKKGSPLYTKAKGIYKR